MVFYSSYLPSEILDLIRTINFLLAGKEFIELRKDEFLVIAVMSN